MKSAAISALVVVIILAFAAGYLANHYSSVTNVQGPQVSPSSSSISASTTSSISTSSTLVEAISIYNAYQDNSALANSQYGGKTLYVSGEIADVDQQQNGSYQSCIMASTVGSPVTETGCQYADEGYIGGYIVFNWKNQAAAAALGQINSNLVFRGDCTVGGFENGNLILNSCTVTQVFPTT